MEEGNKHQRVTFMQFCAMVANFTKTSSRMLESIYQSVLLFHKLDPNDVDGRREKDQELVQHIRELRDSTAAILIVLKNNFSNISALPPSQQLVLNFSTSLIRIIIAFSNSAKKLDPEEQIGRLYKEVLSSAKQTVSAINFSLKGNPHYYNKPPTFKQYNSHFVVENYEVFLLGVNLFLLCFLQLKSIYNCLFIYNFYFIF